MAGYSRVTHPSATKLSPEGDNSVRLECVMHAASVHPEPGSNSLNNSISCGLPHHIDLQSIFWLLLFVRVSINSKEFLESLAFLFEKLLSCCSIFKELRPPLFSAARILYHYPYPLVNPLFSFSLTFFSRLTHLIRGHPHPVFIPWTPAGASGSVISSDGMRRTAAILAPIGKKTTPFPHGRG